MKKLFLYGVLAWLVLSILAIINGSIRNFVYKPFIGDLAAHQISTVLFMLILFLITFIFLRLLKEKYSSKEYWFLGFMWALMTILFEFIFGHFVIGHSWEKLFADYNILQGRIWGLVIIATAISPRIMSRFV